jgi:hypothetical protein
MRKIMMALLAAAALAGGIAAPASASASASATALASAAKAAPRHYIGHCHAQGQIPVCAISAKTAYDVRHIYIHVWGSISRPGPGAAKIEAMTDNLCEQGFGSGSVPRTFVAVPTYTRQLGQSYVRPDECFSDAEIYPASPSAHGSIHANMYYTRRDGR